MTLDEIIAIEHDKLLQQTQSNMDSGKESSHSGRDLNPYQTVPPILHQNSEESTSSNDGNSQSYSNIHKVSIITGHSKNTLLLAVELSAYDIFLGI